MYAPRRGYLTLKILRSSPRRHRGERTTTIPMKMPPLPVGFTVDGCTILCGRGESVTSEKTCCKIWQMWYTESNQSIGGRIGMTDQELLQAIRTITREEIQESEKRAMATVKEEIQESEKRTMAAVKEEIQEAEKRIKKDVITLMDAEFKPQFNLLAENQSIMMEKLERLEEKVDSLEDKVLEHDFRLRIIK